AAAGDAGVPPRLERPLGGSSPGYAPRPDASSAGEPSRDGEPILFTYPLLVDEGRLSVGADKLKAALEEPPFVELHPSDAERLGLHDGSTARIRTEAGQAELPVRVTDGIAPGSGFVPYNQPGFAANTILSGSFLTTATLEPIAEEVSA